ncbi:MAG: DUF2520 domain-containing protein [Prevotellaceae bacterium]|jgi:predicted short-subunit dehydrogenase-like oxidoreductase (DUF2520 family)|nr:DUF2520 domain-containing protein [Prevotellaceae bacterium]
MKLVILGSGNVATQLANSLYANGCEISQVFSRNKENAETLATQVNAQPIDNLKNIDITADVCVFSVSDDAIAPLLTAGGNYFGKKTLLVHTAGSVSIDVFSGFATNYGVLYPLQTFSKNREVNFNEIPLFIEGNDFVTEQKVRDLARVLSFKIYPTTSEQRKRVHLAAVFACNFANNMYHNAGKILEASGLPFEVLRPLILETARKVQHLSPAVAQTGPAVRHDNTTMQQHLKMLENQPHLQEIYKMISEDISPQTQPPNPQRGLKSE